MSPLNDMTTGLNSSPAMLPFNITRAAHAEYRVTDLERARTFYVDSLGMLEIDREGDRIYLGCLEEREKYFFKELDKWGKEDIAWSREVIETTVHAPGSPSVGTRTWPEIRP